jgi:hypothetical protein
MLDKSFFVSDVAIPKDITLSDGTTHKMFFKEISAIEFRKFFIAEQSNDDDVKATSMAKLIASSLCNEDGKPAITFHDALRLKGNAMNAIIAAVMEINGAGTEAKNA